MDPIDVMRLAELQSRTPSTKINEERPWNLDHKASHKDAWLAEAMRLCMASRSCVGG